MTERRAHGRGLIGHAARDNFADRAVAAVPIDEHDPLESLAGKTPANVEQILDHDLRADVHRTRKIHDMLGEAIVDRWGGSEHVRCPRRRLVDDVLDLDDVDVDGQVWPVRLELADGDGDHAAREHRFIHLIRRHRAIEMFVQWSLLSVRSSGITAESERRASEARNSERNRVSRAGSGGVQYDVGRCSPRPGKVREMRNEERFERVHHRDRRRRRHFWPHECARTSQPRVTRSPFSTPGLYRIRSPPRPTSARSCASSTARTKCIWLSRRKRARGGSLGTATSSGHRSTTRLERRF